MIIKRLIFNWCIILVSGFSLCPPSLDGTLSVLDFVRCDSVWVLFIGILSAGVCSHRGVCPLGKGCCFLLLFSFGTVSRRPPPQEFSLLIFCLLGWSACCHWCFVGCNFVRAATRGHERPAEVGGAIIQFVKWRTDWSVTLTACPLHARGLQRPAGVGAWPLSRLPAFRSLTRGRWRHRLVRLSQRAWRGRHDGSYQLSRCPC